jgi:hypothetical protein
LFVVLFSLPGCTPQGSDTPSELRSTSVDARVSELLGGESAIALMRTADQVTAFRMARRKTQWGDFHGHPVASEEIPVEQEAVEELLQILTDAESYFWDDGKTCTLDPGVGMRFRKNDSELGLLFCFTCDQLFIAFGEHKRLVDTDPARAALLNAMKRVFPQDKIIQSLQ